MSGLLIDVVPGVNRFARDVVEPMLVAVYSAPKVALYPILLPLIGLGMSAKVAFGAITLLIMTFAALVRGELLHLDRRMPR